MLRSAIPLRFTYSWGQQAAGAFIRTVPVSSQIGVTDGAASFQTGFVPDNFTSLAGGGVPPFGQDFNGALNITTTWDIWYQAGAPIPYDATFSAAQSGYPQGAKVDSAIVLGVQWFSLVDGNTTNPDDPLTSANWARVGIPVGVPVPFRTSTLPSGFIAMNALTIGSGSSNAAGLADPSALFLYVSLWPDTTLPILTSGGVPTTRGANAVADFSANKQLTLPSGKGSALKGVDTMGGAASTTLSGVPVTSGNTTTPGSVVGGNLQGLIIANLPAVIPAGTITVTNGTITPSTNNFITLAPFQGHGVTGSSAVGTSDGTAVTWSQGTSTASFTGTSFGGNTAHNNTDQAMLVFWGLKL